MSFLKSLLPKSIKDFINIILNRKIRLRGEFSLWEDALKKSSGYNDPLIFNKSKNSIKKILNKEAKYERDTVLFYNEDPDIQLIKIIKKLYKNKNIKICDFGGSFGSSYFQNITFLNKKKIEWNVVEQKKIVEYANKHIKIKKLNFFNNLDFISKKKIDLIIFSSVIQYLEAPYLILKKITKNKIKNIIISRTPFSHKKEIIKIQYVPKHIYNSSYPVRIFNKFSFLKFMRINGYKIKKKLKVDEKIDKYSYESFYFVKD
jgi:putative methyltransferase (TIGR04325 family)